MGYTKKTLYGSVVHIYEGSPKSFIKLSGSNSTSTLSRLNYDHDKIKCKEVCRINASLFSGTNVLGWDVSDVHNFRPTSSEGRFDFIAYKDGTFDIGDFVSGQITKDIDWAYSPSDILVQDGKEVDKYSSWREEVYKAKHPRTLFGIKADGGKVFVVVEGRTSTSTGITGYQAAQLMLDLGCIHAVNNDGGGSSQMNIDGKIVNILSDGTERKIVNALFMFEPIEEEGEEEIIIPSETEIMRAPMNIVKITGSMEAPSHVGTRCLDYAGADTSASKVFAPCTLKIVKIHTSANTVFWESVAPVKTPIGVFYVCGTFGHDNYINSNCKVGAVIKQGEYMYDEGGKGSGQINKFATHMHARFGKGKFKKDYWYDVGNGNWEISCEGGPLYHYDAFFIHPDQKVVKYEDNPANNYPWVYYNETEYKDLEDTFVKFLKKVNIRNCPSLNGQVTYTAPIGMELKALRITEKLIDGYYWVETEKGWNALISGAASLVEKTVEVEKETNEQIQKLQQTIVSLRETNASLLAENLNLKDALIEEAERYNTLIEKMKKLIGV